MGEWMSRWREVPLSLWAFDGTMLANLVVIIAGPSDAPVGALVLAPICILAWAYFLLKGFRWLWLVTLALYAATIPGILTGSVHAAAAVLTIVGLILLLLPTTRAYFAVQTKSASS